ECGVADISVVGTAVFRWIRNRQDVLEKINRETGLTVDVIEEEQEGVLGLFGIPYMLQCRGMGQDIGDDDTIMLLDQGGGSLEITWMKWRDRDLVEPPYKIKLFDSLGTVALRRKFFGLSADGTRVVDPLNNRARISRQKDQITEQAKREISEWMSAPYS